MSIWSSSWTGNRGGSGSTSSTTNATVSYGAVRGYIAKRLSHPIEGWSSPTLMLGTGSARTVWRSHTVLCRRGSDCRAVGGSGRPSGCSARTSTRSDGRTAVRSTWWRTSARTRPWSMGRSTVRATTSSGRALETHPRRAVRLLRLPLRLHQVGLAEDAQMPGHLRLGEPERRDDSADRPRPGAQQLHDAEPVGLGQCGQPPRDVGLAHATEYVQWCIYMSTDKPRSTTPSAVSRPAATSMPSTSGSGSRLPSASGGPAGAIAFSAAS
jgi:hypothetical protein